MKTILLFQRIIPHYRKPFFIYLKEKVNDITICYGQTNRKESIKNDSNLNRSIFHKYHHIYLRYSKKNIYVTPGFLLKAAYYKILVTSSEIGNLNLIVIFIYKYLLKKKIILWTFGYDPVTGFNPNTRLIDKIKLFYLQRADAVIFYWEKGKEVTSYYSKKKEHYFVAPNTIDTNKLLNIKKKFDLIGKEEIKKQLGVSQKNHFVYIGRLLADKQIDFLIQAFHSFDSSVFRLTIVGDGPEKFKLIDLINTLNANNIFIIGSEYNEEKAGKWLYISEALCMPGRLGNSVVHSFCFGTPVISQNKDYFFHGEGISYLENNFNGFLTIDGDIEDYKLKIMQLSSDTEIRRQFSKNALKTIEEKASLKIMADGFINVLRFVNDGDL